jgi:parallel beta-helix repeat protein
MNGFHLENVDNVVLRGFTVRDFGMGATETLPSGMLRGGMGNGIYLLNASYNTIENDRVTQNDMMGIDLWDSSNNIIRYNVAFDNDTGGSACGIMLRGRQSARNYIFQNLAYNNGLAGLMIADSGPANLVIDNDSATMAKWGIENRNTAVERDVVACERDSPQPARRVKPERVFSFPKVTAAYRPEKAA